MDVLVRLDEIRSGFCRLATWRGRFHEPHGWVHDRFGTGWMLQTDALSAILFVVVALFVLHKINAARAQDLAAGQQPRRLELHERRDS